MLDAVRIGAMSAGASGLVIPAPAKNVIFMVSDGFGDTAATAYRYFKGTAEVPAWEAVFRPRSGPTPRAVR